VLTQPRRKEKAMSLGGGEGNKGGSLQAENKPCSREDKTKSSKKKDEGINEQFAGQKETKNETGGTGRLGFHCP